MQAARQVAAGRWHSRGGQGSTQWACRSAATAPSRCCQHHRRAADCVVVCAARKEPVHSTVAAQEVIGLIMQMDLDVQLQRCLNTEAYSRAKEVRARRSKIDEEIQGIAERKAARQRGQTTAPAAKASSGLTVADLASEGLRLRTEMQRAVEEERYKDASTYRDLLADLEQESKRLSALSAEWSFKAQPQFRLGQRVLHRSQGYRAVIVGWDIGCCETDAWLEATQTPQDKLNSIFYLLLVDMRDWPPTPAGLPPLAYACEADLLAPELEPKGLSWVEVHGEEPLEHPFAEMLFLGQDGRGDYLPCRYLRNKYNVQRRDVFKPGQEPEAAPES